MKSEEYFVVQATSIEDLQKLVNFKTKNGWRTVGGMVLDERNFSRTDGELYRYCQSMIRDKYLRDKYIETEMPVCNRKGDYLGKVHTINKERGIAFIRVDWLDSIFPYALKDIKPAVLKTIKKSK